MNQDIAKRWTSALRSGKYQQIQGSLHRPVAEMVNPSSVTVMSGMAQPGYCCLGVLCVLSNIDSFDENDYYEAPIIFYLKQ